MTLILFRFWDLIVLLYSWHLHLFDKVKMDLVQWVWTLIGSPFYAAIVSGLGLDFLFKSILASCDLINYFKTHLKFILISVSMYNVHVDKINMDSHSSCNNVSKKWRNFPYKCMWLANKHEQSHFIYIWKNLRLYLTLLSSFKMFRQFFKFLWT